MRLRLGTGPCLLSLLLLLPAPARAQRGAPASTPTAADQAAAADFLGRSTPRGTVLGFFIAARKGDDEHAVEYLNTTLRGKAASTLAHQLFIVLDRRLPPTLNELSNRPEGSLSNLVKPDQELVGTIKTGNGDLDILLERVDLGKSTFIWQFSRKTLQSIPTLYADVNVGGEESLITLPEFLLNTRFLSISLFQWFAVFGVLPFAYFFSGLVGRLLSPVAGRIRRRIKKESAAPDPDLLPQPIRLLLLAILIRWAISRVSLPLLTRQFWIAASGVIMIGAFVWLLILLASWGEAYIRNRLKVRNYAAATSMLRLAGTVVDILIVFTGFLVALYYFGVDPTAALAGLGVGGIAVALAAQKTLENVIAGVSIILDSSVNVGDTIAIGNTQGVIDGIGLRSTRVRTLDRTMLSIPNGQLAQMTIENLSARDKFWFHPIVPLRPRTTAVQMQTVLEGIRKVLKESRDLDPDSIRVNFLRFGSSSLDIEVFAYILARNVPQFLQFQEELLLQIIQCVESSGVEISPELLIRQAASANAAPPQ